MSCVFFCSSKREFLKNLERSLHATKNICAGTDENTGLRTEIQSCSSVRPSEFVSKDWHARATSAQRMADL